MHDVGGDVGVSEYGVAEWLEMKCACEYLEGVRGVVFVAAYVGKGNFASDYSIESVDNLKQGGGAREEGVYKHCKGSLQSSRGMSIGFTACGAPSKKGDYVHVLHNEPCDVRGEPLTVNVREQLL